MIAFLKNMYQRYFTHPQSVVLAWVIVLVLAAFFALGELLAPVWIAAVVAYVLDGPTQSLVQRGMQRTSATALVCVIFLSALLFSIFGLAPLLSQQLGQFFSELPGILSELQEFVRTLPERYPLVFNERQIGIVIDQLRQQTTSVGQNVLSLSVAALPGIMTLLVYALLIPLMVFFFLKDSTEILAYMRRFLPTDHSIATGVWHEIDLQIGNYMRGKFWEILIVWAASFVTFMFLDLRYTLLLSLFTGLSVLIPYIGATLMTIPVAIVAYTQWGIGTDLAWTIAAYLILQFLDGNILVPILFSEAVNLHPIAIIAAVLLFGGLWGMWGVFFAIPLATVIKAIIHLWPRQELTS